MTPEQQKALALARARVRANQGAAPAAEAPVESFDPTEGMSTGEKFLAGVGKAAYQAGRTFGLTDDLGDTSAADEALTRTGAGLAGNIAGEVLMTAAPGGAAYKAASTAAKILPRATQTAARMVGGGAAAGAAGAGTMGADVSEGAAWGAAGGPILAGAGVVGGKAIDLAKRWHGGAQKQVVDYLNNIFGGDADKVAKALDELKGFVPGEKPTAGLAAVSTDARFPQLKALEQQARTGPNVSAQFADRDVANQAARVEQLRNIAAPGTRAPAAQGQRTNMSPAEQARESAAAPLYEQARVERVPVSDELEALLSGPEAKASIAAGGRAFEQEVANALAAGRRPPTGTMAANDGTSMLLDPSGRPFVRPENVTQGSMSIDQLQKISQRLKKDIDAIQGPDPTGRKARLIEARTQLEDMMEKGSGSYGQARSTYRQMSEPVNQAAVAQQLVKALQTPSGVERPGAFLSALENAPQTIRRSGAPRFQEIGQIMTPEQMATIEALKRSATREQAFNALEASGRMTPRTGSVAEEIEGVLPPIFDAQWTAARKALRVAGGYSDEQAQKLLDEAMLDPAALSQLLKMIPSSQQGPIRALLGKVYDDPMTRGAITASAIGSALRKEE